jgi:hypothetical protein
MEDKTIVISLKDKKKKNSWSNVVKRLDTLECLLTQLICLVEDRNELLETFLDNQSHCDCSHSDVDSDSDSD